MIDMTKSLSDELAAVFGDKVAVSQSVSGMVTIQVPVEMWLETAQTLRDEPRFAFNQLSDLCGVDYLGFGQVEWETTEATREGFSRGVEALGPGRFDWQHRPESSDAAQRFGVVAHLLSTVHNMRLRMKTFASDEGLPIGPSLVESWNCANWYEREAFDLFGVIFEGHPD